MLETRNERFLRMKKEKQSQKVQMMNQSLKRSLIVVGTTACVGLYISPVEQLLSANYSVVEASTAATQFLRNIIPAAQNVARGKDIYTSVMIAQAALESGWGTSALSKAPNHNLFGVKGSYNGQSVNMQTLEDSGGQNYYSIQANFRKYPSYKESLEDYVDKIVNGISGVPLFYSGAWKSKTNSYQDATSYLTGRYATDTAYGAKLNRIIEQFGLTKYDTETAVNMAEKIASNETTTTTGNSYTVVSGDSLYAIARKTGTSIQELLSLNGLNLNSIIHPGQVLALSSKAATTETKQEESASKEEKAAEETINEETSTNTKQASEGGTYTVVSGDGLYAIARKTGTSIDDLLSLNGLSLNSTIYPGQVLKLSVSSETSAHESSTSNEEESSTKETTSEESAASSEQESTGGTYTVVSGDGLYAIARKTGTSIDDLLSLNGLSLNSTIYPGQVLKLSVSSETSAYESSTSNEEESSSSTKETTSEESAASSEQESTGGTYTVVSGDGLYAIARKTGTSIGDLLSLNGLSLNSTIYPGQVLTLSANSEVATSEETTSSTNAKMYYVHSGDSLYRIAYNHGISLSTLLEWNHLSVDSIIHPGQGLIVSNGSSSSSEEAETTAEVSEEASSGSVTTYTVQPGDGLWRIAKNHGLTLDELKSLNQLTSNIIQPGQVLIVSK